MRLFVSTGNNVNQPGGWGGQLWTTTEGLKGSTIRLFHTHERSLQEACDLWTQGCCPRSSHSFTCDLPTPTPTTTQQHNNTTTLITHHSSLITHCHVVIALPGWWVVVRAGVVGGMMRAPKPP
jgi:hypothetical protein